MSAITGNQIPRFRLAVLESALKLEIKGMRSSRGSAAETIRQLIGSRTRDKAKLLAEFQKYRAENA